MSLVTVVNCWEHRRYSLSANYSTFQLQTGHLSSPSLCLLICEGLPHRIPLRVFDVGGELGEDVDACSVGFPMFRSQSGVPARQDVLSGE